MRVASVLIVVAALIAFSQTPGPGPGAGNRPAVSASVRLEDWALFRSAASPILGWKVGVPARAFRQLTFSEAAAKADALGLAAIEGFSGQKFSAEIPKNLDYKLTSNEREAVRDRLRALNLRMPSYFTASIGADEDSSRAVFEFAKSLGVETIVSSPDPASLPMIDKLANEFGINVALNNSPNPKSLEGHSKRIGANVDLASWLQEGIKPVEGLTILKDRALTVNLRDRIAPGALSDFIRELYRLQIKPSFITVDATDAKDPSAELARSFETFDKALHPVITDRVNELSRAAIRGPDRLPPEERQKIEAALPQRAAVKPKKLRKLLVMDLNVAYGGHRSIPHANLALELMGKRTGAYEAIFSNDLDNLKYQKIRQFDAVYLNNTVGMVFVDPEVREGLTRFVREGGGLAGNHGVSHASMDWPEFGEMIGTKWGVHREPTEQATIRIDDPNHPLTAAFHGKEFVYQDEFFRFPIGPYSRDKLRVLLSIDVEKTDMNQGRPCAKPCVRADQDYAVSWIHAYGKGRVFFCILGHNPTLYMTPSLAEYFLAGIQFILGDLEADTTPSAKLPAAGKVAAK
jgi:type 1 glutamine amidotransferase/sugar phosphate isomerase/epimerase